MYRNFKLLTLSVAALSAFAAPAAQAEATFTVPKISPLAQTRFTQLPDGTGKTAHWLLDISNAEKSIQMSVTCNEVLGEGLATGPELSDITIVTPSFSGCTIAGHTATAQNQGCSFTYTSGGGFDIVKAAGHLCEHTREAIVFTDTVAECTVEIAQMELTGVGYHTVKLEGESQTVITAQLNEQAKFTYEARGSACPFGTTSNGTLTTWNSILTGEEASFGKLMLNVEWHV